MYDIKPKTLYHWYRNYLSDYKPDKESGKWLKEKIPIADKNTGEILHELPVYVVKPENIGESMAIDDKQIGRDTFTIMTNQQTGKIAMLVETLKSEELQMSTALIGEAINKIKSISCDMSPSYLKFIESCFKQSAIVIDKFHVVRYVLEALQDVRRRMKTQIMEQLPKGKVSRKSPQNEQLLSSLELLRRSKYMLTQSENNWTEIQKELSEQLFFRFPEIKKAYQLSEDFKKWYDPSNAIKPRIILEQQLYQWYEQVEESRLKEFINVVKMIEKHEENILNYFNKKLTNAKAENMNGKIQRFITNNFGVRDKDFTLYRIANYFS